MASSKSTSQPAIRTFGHGTLSEEDFATIVTDAGIDRIVDIRSFPGSRRNPQFKREEMQRWLPDHDIEYQWMQDLGGRRKPVEGTRHVVLRHPSFRAYADYMETPEFVAGIDELLDLAGTEADGTVAVMCSESVWWRCHRRLVADYLTLARDVDVRHLMHDGRLTEHAPTDGARLDDDGEGVTYDLGATPPLPTD